MISTMQNFWQPHQKPCASCPFRKDVDLMYWAKEHYQMLLDSEGAIPGITFGCHKHRNQPREEYTVCAGWLHDQRERNLPSIALRLDLTSMAPNAVQATHAIETVEDGGLDLFTLVEVCEKNIAAYEFYGDDSGPVSPEQFDEENE